MLQLWWFQTSSQTHHPLTLTIEEDILKGNRHHHPKRHPLLSSTNSTEYLPNHVIENVKTFLFFIGYARSGHSIIASLLDAHPNIVMAHEYSLFSQWTRQPALHSNKSWLFSILFTNSKHNSESGMRKRNMIKKGYSLTVPGWWQGKYDNRIYVIGDKAGGMTAKVYRRSPTSFISTYHELQKTVNIPIAVIHVLRNPYDNIATMLLYNMHVKQRVNATHKYINDTALSQHIISYFKQVKGVMDMIKKVPLNVIEIHNTDMISNPKGTMRRICSHLQIECHEKYLHMCAQLTYSSESHSRELVHWTAENIQLVAENIKTIASLKRYSYSQ